MEGGETTTHARACPQCHTELVDTVEGLCPPCLLDFEPPSSGPVSLGGLPRRLGRYMLLEEIKRGGMGVAYQARNVDSGNVIALKQILAGGLGGLDEVRLFYAEAHATAELAHPNIIPVLDIGEEDGRPYFTMPLMAGNLAGRIKEIGADLPKAARLVATVARAVHHAHQGLIIHRDLKPANILLDAAGEPFVADFGVAKHLGKQASSVTGTVSGAVIGTPSYMSPEQAAGQSKRLTTAADVYSLGAILYELLTGRPPFEGDTPAAILRDIIEKDPVPPHRLNSRVDPGLEIICLTCLEKDPAHRYGSAEELALTIDRYLNGERPVRVSRAERAWRWCLRHPMPAGLITALGTFLIIMTPSVVSLSRGQEAAERAQIRQVNMNSAAMVAGTVLSQLRALSDAVERSASEEGLARALENGDDDALQTWCDSTYNLYEDPSHGLKLNGNSPFDMWFVLDENGVSRAQFKVRHSVGRDYKWRDYFRGSWKLADKGLRSTYVSRAFQAENDGLYKFVISAPIYGSNGRPIGVLAAGVPTAATLGSLVVHDTQSVTVLAAPRDRERDAPLPASTHLILLHPDYAYGEATPIENEQVRRLDEASRGAQQRIERPLGLPAPDLVTSSDNYEDPVAKNHPEYAGRWLAGFAPVGHTGFVVIVQTREDKALDSEIQLGGKLAKWAFISGSPGVLVVLLAAWYERRRKARRARR